MVRKEPESRIPTLVKIVDYFDYLHEDPKGIHQLYNSLRAEFDLRKSSSKHDPNPFASAQAIGLISEVIAQEKEGMEYDIAQAALGCAWLYDQLNRP